MSSKETLILVKEVNKRLKKKSLTQTYKRDSKMLKQWPNQKSDLFINKRSEEPEMTKCVILLIKGFYCSGILQEKKDKKKKGFCMWMRSALLQQDCNNGEIVLCLSGGSLKQVA